MFPLYIFLPSSTPNACIHKYFCAFVCIYMYTHLYKNTCIYTSLHISSWALHSAYARVVGLGITSHSSAKNRHCLLGVNYMKCLQHARTSISSMNDWRGLVHRVLKIFSPWCYLRLGRITIIIVKSLCYSKDVRGAI